MNKYNILAKTPDDSKIFGDPFTFKATLEAESAVDAENKVRDVLKKAFNFNGELIFFIEPSVNNELKLWVDDVRKPPSDKWLWAKSVLVAKEYLSTYGNNIKFISLDHDAGDYAQFGGDYIKILDWLEEMEHEGAPINFTFHIHSMNTVGRFNMLNIIEKNHWKWQLWLDEADDAEKTFEKTTTLQQNLKKCHECVHEGNRCIPPANGECKSFKKDGWHPKKDPPDGGFYG